jgi:hypothetical protein
LSEQQKPSSIFNGEDFLCLSVFLDELWQSLPPARRRAKRLRLASCCQEEMQSINASNSARVRAPLILVTSQANDIRVADRESRAAAGGPPVINAEVAHRDRLLTMIAVRANAEKDRGSQLG